MGFTHTVVLMSMLRWNVLLFGIDDHRSVPVALAGVQATWRVRACSELDCRCVGSNMVIDLIAAVALG